MTGLSSPCLRSLYSAVLDDVRASRTDAPVFKHHIERIERQRGLYDDARPYRAEDPDLITVDYLAAMTDEYFLAAHRFMCPKSTHRVEFRDYFDGFAQSE